MSVAMLRAGSGRAAVCDHASQRLSLHVLRGDEQVIAELLERVDDGDGRMGDRGGGSSLAPQAFAQIGCIATEPAAT